jgi:hypothetical protein
MWTMWHQSVMAFVFDIKYRQIALVAAERLSVGYATFIFDFKQGKGSTVAATNTERLRVCKVSPNVCVTGR